MQLVRLLHCCCFFKINFMYLYLAVKHFGKVMDVCRCAPLGVAKSHHADFALAVDNDRGTKSPHAANVPQLIGFGIGMPPDAGCNILFGRYGLLANLVRGGNIRRVAFDLQGNLGKHITYIAHKSSACDIRIFFFPSPKIDCTLSKHCRRRT